MKATSQGPVGTSQVIVFHDRLSPHLNGLIFVVRANHASTKQIRANQVTYTNMPTHFRCMRRNPFVRILECIEKVERELACLKAL
jgi:hypothetical protein